MVKSAKDKRFEELAKSCDEMRVCISDCSSWSRMRGLVLLFMAS